MCEASVKLVKLGSGEQDNTDGSFRVEMSQFSKKLYFEILIGVVTELAGNLIFYHFSFFSLSSPKSMGISTSTTSLSYARKLPLALIGIQMIARPMLEVNDVTQFRVTSFTPSIGLLTRC